MLRDQLGAEILDGDTQSLCASMKKIKQIMTLVNIAKNNLSSIIKQLHISVCFIASFSWLYRGIFKRNRAGYIKKYLKINNELHTGFDRKLCQKFADEYLRDDGVFVIRVIAKNSTDLVATDLVDKLWKLYKNKKMKKDEDEPPTIEPTLPTSEKEKEALNPN